LGSVSAVSITGLCLALGQVLRFNTVGASPPAWPVEPVAGSVTRPPGEAIAPLMHPRRKSAARRLRSKRP